MNAIMHECMNEERQTIGVISTKEKSVTLEAGKSRFLTRMIGIGMPTRSASGGCKPVVTAFEPPGKRVDVPVFARNEIAVTGYNPGLFTTNPGCLVAIFPISSGQIRRQAFVF